MDFNADNIDKYRAINPITVMERLTKEKAKIEKKADKMRKNKNTAIYIDPKTKQLKMVVLDKKNAKILKENKDKYGNNMILNKKPKRK